MRKIVYLFFIVLFASNISVGQELSIKLDYPKLQEVAAQLGTKNELALYAVKENGITVLKYAVYNPKTREVTYFDGHIDTNFLNTYNSLVLDKTVKFRYSKTTTLGAAGISRKGKNYIVKTGLEFINTNIQKPEDRNKSVYEIYLLKNGKLKKRIIRPDGKPIVGGGGGIDPTVYPAPPK